MRRLLLIILAAGSACAAWGEERVDQVYELYRTGDVSQARQEFQKLPQASTRDGNRLFVTALLEPSGQRARELMETALRSNLDGKYQAEARFRLIQLAEAAGDTAAALSDGATFLDKWGKGPHRAQTLAILAAHAADGSASQNQRLEQLGGEFGDSYYGQFAVLTQAGKEAKAGKYKTAVKLCRQIHNSADENLTPAGFILLAEMALAQGNSEEALLNYNIVREQYPHAIGQDELLNDLKNVSDRRSSEESTEKFEDVKYAVQVGVFADKDNAERMADQIGGYGFKTRITRRSISGNTYHVVLAGRFATLQEAQTAKQKLEMRENEVFKVVVDDEK